MNYAGHIIKQTIPISVTKIGLTGSTGSSGSSTYFYVRYADDPYGTNINDTAGKYIGTYTTTSSIKPTSYWYYTWTLFQGAVISEIYIPLYYPGSSSSISSSEDSAYRFLRHGSTSTDATSSSQNILHTVASGWPTGTRFAFEAVVRGSNTNGLNVVLTNSTGVGFGVSIGSYSTEAIKIRSTNSIVLSAGSNIYLMIIAPSGGTIYLTKADLIVIPG